MGKIKIGDKLIDVRPLTRGEIEGLKDCGFGVALCIPTVEQANDAYEKSIQIVLSDDDQAYLMTRPPSDTKKVWVEMLKETYGAPDEEKNSSSTSAGTPIENG